MAENFKYKDDPKPECKYGTKCYQKNPDHLKKFKHPPKKMFSIFDVSSKNKRQKLDDSVKIESVKESASNSSFHDKITPKSVEIKESASNSHSDKTAPNSAEKKVENGSHEENSQLVDEELNKSSDCAVQNSKIKYHSLPEDIPNFIKELFLVEMPKDFYSFREMYDSDHSIRSFLKSIDLKLVGPFDVLSKNLPVLNNQTHYILHWRFYFDPPEFQVNIKSNFK